MPSFFELAFSDAALDGLYAFRGVAAVYTGADGASQSGMILIDRDDARPIDAPGRGGEIQTGEIRCRQGEFSKIAKAGRFLVEGVEVWTVANTPTVANGQYYCAVSRSGTERLMPRRFKE